MKDPVIVEDTGVRLCGALMLSQAIVVTIFVFVVRLLEGRVHIVDGLSGRKDKWGSIVVSVVVVGEDYNVYTNIFHIYCCTEVRGRFPCSDLMDACMNT